MAVQEEIKYRSIVHPVRKGSTSVLTGAIHCVICGKNYRRKKTKYNIFWCCDTFNTKGKDYCASKMIPEETLECTVASVLGFDTFDDAEFTKQIERIDAYPDNLMRFVFRNGAVDERTWQDKSRSESWTKEMREAARQKKLCRRQNNG